MTHPIAYETIQRQQVAELHAEAAAYRRAKTARRQQTTRRWSGRRLVVRRPKYA